MRMDAEAAGERASENCVLVDASFQPTLPTEPIFVLGGLNGTVSPAVGGPIVRPRNACHGFSRTTVVRDNRIANVANNQGLAVPVSPTTSGPAP